MKDLGTLPGDTNSYAYGINPTSSYGVQVVGESDSASGQRRAFLWTQNGGMISLGTLGGTESEAAGINDAGQVTGDARLSGDTVTHAFLWQNGVMTDLGTTGGNFSSGHAINTGGQVAGELLPKNSTEDNAFHWTPTTLNGTKGKMADLGTLNLGGTIKLSDANGINDAGDVVGWSGDGLGIQSHAFYWPGSGGIKDLNSLVPANTGFAWLDNATGINNNGQIIGTGQLESPLGPYEHAVLLTPTSSTATAAPFTSSTVPTAVQIGSFTATPNSTTTGSLVTLTAANVTTRNVGKTITQVAFYVRMNGVDTLLGYGTQTSPGTWTMTFTVNLTSGNYTLIAQAEDSSGAFSDPLALSLTVL
jgi:probable HAF family extracellular repeat protein